MNQLVHSFCLIACLQARLLHYFAMPGPQLSLLAGTAGAQQPPQQQENEDSWCGLHTDHGSLTGACVTISHTPHQYCSAAMSTAQLGLLVPNATALSAPACVLQALFDAS